MSTRFPAWLCALFAALVIGCGWTVPSRAADFGILSSIDVEPTSKAIEIHVRLNLPMRYQNHAPQRGGDFVEVQLRPVSTAETRVLQQRQSLPWKSTVDVPLVDVIYEGNFPGTPTIVLNFSRPVSFEVRGGRDFRSIIVSIPKAEAAREDRTLAPAPSTGAPPTGAVALPPVAADETRPPRAPQQTPSTRTAASVAPTEAALEALPFTINLYSTAGPIDLDKVPRIPAFGGRQLYTTQATVDGKLWHRLRLGFFLDTASAKAAIKALESSYPQAWAARATREERRAQATPTARETALAPSVAAGAVAAATLQPARPVQGRPLDDQEQAALMDEARTELTAGDYSRAVQIYTKILLLPPGPYSREAQELLGLARERNGQIAHAKAEYGQYLQQYPEGPDTERVQQRLAGLLTASRLPQEKLRPVASAQSESNWEVFGSFTQFYRRDSFDTETGGATTTQSALFSDLNVSARNRGENFDFRAQFTGGYDWDLLDSVDSESRVSELYVDGLARNPGLSARLGRQTRSSGGVLGRFDGALLGYQIAPSVLGNLVVGFPVARTSDTAVETDKYFYGLSFDLGTYWDHWDFQTYIIEQKANDLTDRRAVGGELRYFDSHRTFFSLVDYDIFFNKLNTALGVGTWTLESGTSINANIDYRNSPVLTTTNAIQGQGVNSLEELRALFTDDELKQLALDRTATSTTATLGASHPFSPQFQVSGDATVTKLSGTPASGGVPATPATGYDFLYNIQFTGTDLIKTGDLGIVGLRYADLDNSDLFTLSLNTRYPVVQEFRINPRFDVIYRKNKNDSGTRMTYRPFLRLEYQWKRNIRFESEIGGDWIEDDGLFGSERIRTYFVNLGYRVDF
ncbi:MAG: outer membrane protein assembly factor BamD [Gammaproteobacteria bacterium]|nr:outer membrane protein assembly factor BamD [Gammaproteobacteria bacterium]MDX2461405.1 outer membrane protein assembly factor BamD [Gammaproteobacteria bacterium]